MRLIKYKYDVFVSYASEDRVWAEMLAARLRDRAVRVWFDRWHLKPGDHLLLRLNEAMQSSCRMLAIWTPNYFRDAKVWTLVESFSRQHSDPLSADRPLIPVFRQDCSVPPTLENIIPVDFRDHVDFDQSFAELMQALEVPECELGPPIDAGPVDSQIVNPYLPYSSGALVADPAMFFGREDTLDFFVRELSQDGKGRCLLLYGQKRSGKSSLLRQLERRLQPPLFPVVTSLGMIVANISANGDSLVNLLLFSLRSAIEDRIEGASVPSNSEQTLGERSIQSFREGLWAAEEILLRAGWKRPRIVFLIDEFSYLYTYIKQGLIPGEFMREWKALLECHAFNALLVGQDSMPSFMAEYPNEFGVISTVRMNYLSPAEATRLAEVPVLLDGKTRYRGKALETVLSLTAGSPYYLQLFCSRLIEHLNSRKRLLITEADVAEVKATLLSGTDRLDDYHFDSLITAAEEPEALFTREQYLNALLAIARNSDCERGAPPHILSGCDKPVELLTDLRQRGIVDVTADGTINIQVGLFAEWLRTNPE